MMGNGYGYDMMVNGYGYDMTGAGFGMMIFSVILIGIAVFMVYKLFQNNNTRDIGVTDNSLNILNERFARGEINEEEYNNKKNLLINHKKY